MFPLVKPLLLASNSPRRKELLTLSGFEFEVKSFETDESYPGDLPSVETARYICRKKADVVQGKFPHQLILTADTVVILHGEVLGKPGTMEEARKMLQALSGQAHRVTTAVCLIDDLDIIEFEDSATVWFKKLTDHEIEFYLNHGHPTDKAGGYGIQEWIGMTGIQKIEGSYYTIMGLPTHLVYERLLPYSLLSTTRN
ncbi:septum formation protein [Dyadobacter jejuensis]|uniref:dTTP/UTP pyrophosphatase n=1 Tax=Dyadobacter jejuensis TaxID=1082580 RepID=A0A316AMZ3_9BACT|nr:Maf family protein [Dyadobacter jejuensis]PWJ58828.1 septum formation protein [Dyadobacter jejuensis]